MIAKIRKKILSIFFKRYTNDVIDVLLETDEILNNIKKVLHTQRCNFSDSHEGVEVNYKVLFFNKVDRNERYFIDRIENGKINNYAPEWAKYVISIAVEQIPGKELLVYYDDIIEDGSKVPEKAKIHKQRIRMNQHDLGNKYVNFIRFFVSEVGKEEAVQSVLSRVVCKEREFSKYGRV